MKTIIKVLSVLAVIFIAACSEDVFVKMQKISYLAIPATLEECPNGGYKTEIYVDGVLDGVLPVLCNGEDGEDFDVSDLVFKTDLIPLNELCRVRIVYVNEVELFRDTICNGEDGDTYVPEFTTQTFPLNEFCHVREAYIDGEFFYADTICNGHDGKPGEPGENGQDGEDGKTYILTQFREDCNTGSSWNYKDLGWHVIGTPFSINHINAPNGNGTLVLWDYWMGPSMIMCPKFKTSALNYLSFKIGSKEKWEVQLFLVHENRDSTLVKLEEIKPVEGFIWYKTPTYEQEFVYNVHSSEIEHWDIVRWGLLMKKIGDFEIPEYDWRNYVPNADDFFWTTLTEL